MKPLYDIKEGVPDIRLAVPADEEQLFALLLMLHEENSLFSINHRKVIEGIQDATNRKGAIIYVNKGPSIVATLGMIIATDWYSDDEYLSERWNFVHPAHRRSDWARKLIEQAKWTSEFFKATSGRNVPVQIGINSFDRTEAKIRLYARHMPCIGACFMYGTPTREIAAAKARAEMANVEKVHHGARVRGTRAVPRVVETIIKLSQRDSVA